MPYKDKESQSAYNRSEAGRARQKRYAQSEKGRAVRKAAHDKWRHTPSGKTNRKRNNERRTFVGDSYVGMFGFTPTEIEELKANGTID